jgi:hypothetical protein
MANIKEKAKKAIAEITQLLFGNELLDAVKPDGTRIKIKGDNIAEGAVAVDADGNPLEEGEYTLKDSTLVVAAKGVIVSVKKAVPAAKPGDVTPEKMRAMVYQFAAEAYNNKLASVDREITALKAANKNMSSAFVALMKVVQDIADAPAAEAAEATKSSFKRNTPDSAQRISEIASVIENFKKNRN